MKIGLLRSPVKKGSVRINLQSVYRQINTVFLESWRKNPRKFLGSPKSQEILSYKVILIKKMEALVALGWVS